MADAVGAYLDEHPVQANAWPQLIPTLNGIHPINTITNERSVRTKAVQLNAAGTKAHNLAMCKIDAGVFATWAEYTSVDNANGGSQCFQR